MIKQEAKDIYNKKTVNYDTQYIQIIILHQ